MYYKVLTADNRSCNGGTAVWTPGEWMPAVAGELEPCDNGYHLCRRQDLVRWLSEAIWEAEADGDGEIVETNDNVVVRRARITRRLDTWNERTARLFACDCAERVLPLFERDYPGDDRPRRALEVARRFANGEATEAELVAAWVAAGAADDAARAAAGAAWVAAGAAAGAAAGVAWVAAWGADDAARAAAWDVAWAAAWAATYAAAVAVAGDAWVATWEWQAERLFAYLYPADDAAGEV